MAHHASAKKRIRQTVRRTQVNGDRVGAIRTSVRKAEEAIAGGDQEAARIAFLAAEAQLARGAGRGILPCNRASRKISRLSARVKAMSA